MITGLLVSLIASYNVGEVRAREVRASVLEAAAIIEDEIRDDIRDPAHGGRAFALTKGTRLRASNILGRLIKYREPEILRGLALVGYHIDTLDQRIESDDYESLAAQTALYSAFDLAILLTFEIADGEDFHWPPHRFVGDWRSDVWNMETDRPILEPCEFLYHRPTPVELSQPTLEMIRKHGIFRWNSH